MVSIVLTLFFIVIFSYTIIFQRTLKLSVSQEFYFLVSNSLHVEVSAELVKLEGGAGYLLEKEGREYAVFSVYLNREEGERAQKSLIKEGKQVALFSKKSDILYLKTREEKKNKNDYLGAFQCLHACMEVLDQEISRLDKGATQESSKRILNKLTSLFSFMEKKYNRIFPDFSIICRDADVYLNNIIKNIVYVRDLRYLLCDLSVKYLHLAQEFSL